MRGIVLDQRVEEKVLSRILSAKTPDEKDISLTELLSEENRQRARSFFNDNAKFKNPELNPAYHRIMEYLIEEIIVSGEKMIPRRIVDPDDNDKKFLELYSVLAQLDNSLVDYRIFLVENRSSKLSIESKLDSANTRIKKVKEKWGDAVAERYKLDEGINNHDITKLKLDMDKHKTEISKIEEQIRRYEKRLESLEKELNDYTADSLLRAYFDTAFEKAKELGIEDVLNLEVPESKKDPKTSLDITLLSKKIDEVCIEFIAYEKPKVRKPVKLIYKLGAVAAGVIIAAVGAYSLISKKDSAENSKTTVIENAPIVDFNPQTMEVVYDVPGHGRVKQKLPAVKIDIPSEKYLPGKIEIIKFDPKKMELTIRNTKHNEELASNLGENFQIGKQFISITDYRQEDSDLFNITEVITVYGLDETGGYGPVKEGLPNNPSERKVSKEEIMNHLRNIAKDYQAKPINQAGAFVKDKMIIDAGYDPARRVLTLMTTQHGFDLEIHTEDKIILSGQGYDNIPEALIESNGKHIYLDFSAEKMQVRAVEAGKNFNSLLHFFPLPNLTPKFD